MHLNKNEYIVDYDYVKENHDLLNIKNSNIIAYSSLRYDIIYP